MVAPVAMSTRRTCWFPWSCEASGKHTLSEESISGVAGTIVEESAVQPDACYLVSRLVRSWPAGVGSPLTPMGRSCHARTRVLHATVPSGSGPARKHTAKFEPAARSWAQVTSGSGAPKRVLSEEAITFELQRPN